MKKKYIIPEIEELQFYSDVQILADSGDEHGTVTADDDNMMSKQTGEFEEETPLYQNNSIWGDEEKEN